LARKPIVTLITDFDTTAEEFLESLRLLVLAAFRHRRMRIASGPYTIPLYESDTRRLLEHRGRIAAGQVAHFTDYERPQPGWMDPFVAELAELADSELQFSLTPEHRDSALVQAFQVVLDRVLAEQRRLAADPRTSAWARSRAAELTEQARSAMDEIRQSQFQAVR